MSAEHGQDACYYAAGSRRCAEPVWQRAADTIADAEYEIAQHGQHEAHRRDQEW
ncbi:hypothetical protein GCM10011575_42200 [Microlunatus endophyticus]|uniref:Uncharacterized protein n=1 Tax=Microlunatus endophyticus TaxID=1716077 RepID=A0A917SFN7_9ACTN|nr:hypothetical protein GCM10011575_42200 [Microlunatus endophyticus]